MGLDENSKNTQNKTPESQVKFYKTLACVLGGIVAMAVMAVCVLIGYSISMRFKANTDSIPIDEALGLQNIAAREVTADEKTNLLGKMQEGIDTFESKYLYLTVQDGEESFVAMLYNPDGEVFAQGSETGYTTVYLGDNNAVRFTDYINYGSDSDMFGVVKSAYNMALNGKATVLTCTDDSIVEGYEQLIIDITGWEGIEELYSYVGDDYSAMMLEQLKTGIIEASASQDTGVNADDELNFRFAIALNSETKMVDAVTCYIYFGDTKPEEVVWNDLGANWSYNGYIDVYEWDLLDGWNELDWLTLSDWETVEPAEDLLLEQSEELLAMMDKVQVDNGGESIITDNEGGDTEDEASSSEASSDGTSEASEDISAPVDDSIGE